MSYVSVLARCLVCDQPFECNPHTVPSIPVKGVREPLCRPCAEMVIAARKELGLQVVEIAEDAYSAIDESEL